MSGSDNVTTDQPRVTNGNPLILTGAQLGFGIDGGRCMDEHRLEWAIVTFLYPFFRPGHVVVPSGCGLSLTEPRLMYFRVTGYMREVHFVGQALEDNTAVIIVQECAKDGGVAYNEFHFHYLDEREGNSFWYGLLINLVRELEQPYRVALLHHMFFSTSLEAELAVEETARQYYKGNTFANLAKLLECRRRARGDLVRYYPELEKTLKLVQDD